MSKINKITFVKKILANGEWCTKCNDVEKRLQKDGLINRIHETVVADERDPKSPGMKIAEHYHVERAPFFVVEEENQDPMIYTIYLKFAREVLQQEANEKEELLEALKSDQSLDFL